MKPFLAELAGISVACIVIALVVLRLIGTRVVGASWLPLFDGVASLLLGAMSVGFQNPAGVPVIGLAFAAVGLLRESQESKRIFVFILLPPAQHYAAMLPLFH